MSSKGKASKKAPVIVTFSLASASEHEKSVFRMIAQFYHKRRYSNHPYWRTMLAVANMPETGAAERNLASNIVVLALSKLTRNEKKKTSLTLKVNGEKKSTSYWTYTIKGSKALIDNIVVDPDDEPDLRCDLEVIEEEDERSDDDEMKEQGIVSRTEGY